MNWTLLGYEMIALAALCIITCWLSNNVQKPFLSYRWTILILLLGIFFFLQSLVAFSMAA